MKKWGLGLAAVLLIVSGCTRRADYLDVKTNNGLLKNAARVVTVLCPLGMSGNILISEIVRDGENCGKCIAPSCNACK